MKNPSNVGGDAKTQDRSRSYFSTFALVFSFFSFLPFIRRLNLLPRHTVFPRITSATRLSPKPRHARQGRYSFPSPTTVSQPEKLKLSESVRLVPGILVGRLLGNPRPAWIDLLLEISRHI
jgi:hypothetical protein